MATPEIKVVRGSVKETPPFAKGSWLSYPVENRTDGIENTPPDMLEAPGRNVFYGATPYVTPVAMTYRYLALLATNVDPLKAADFLNYADQELQASSERAASLFTTFQRRHTRTADENRAHNKALEAELKALDAREKVVRTGLDARLAKEQLALEASWKRANEAAGPCKLVIDPKAQELVAPLTKSLSPQAIAHKECVSYDPDDARGAKIYVRFALDSLGKLVVGSIVGLSALSPGGFVHLSSLDRDPAWRVAGAVSFGIALVYYCGKAIAHAFRTASDHRNQNDTLVARVTAFGSAYAVLASVIVLDTVVESRGLLKSASIGALADSLGGSAHSVPPGSSWGLYCAAALLSTGYGCYQAYAGWRSLSPAVVNRLSLAKEEEERAIIASSFTPELCSALGTVRCCERSLAQTEEDASRVSTDFAQRRSTLEGRRRDVTEDLTDREAKLLHQHIAQVRGASAEADKRFRALRSRRKWGFWRSGKGVA